MNGQHGRETDWHTSGSPRPKPRPSSATQGAGALDRSQGHHPQGTQGAGALGVSQGHHPRDGGRTREDRTAQTLWTTFPKKHRVRTALILCVLELSERKRKGMKSRNF